MTITEKIDRLVKFLGELKEAHESGNAFEVECTYYHDVGVSIETRTSSTVGFNTNNTYRVVYKPREWWVNIYKDRRIRSVAHHTREEADKQTIDGRTDCIHVREVIE